MDLSTVGNIKNKKEAIYDYFFFIWDQRDSNPRPRDYESPALPLRHSPVANICIKF